MPKHQPLVSERVVSLEKLDRMHAEERRNTREPVTPAEVDNNIDYLRHACRIADSKPL